MDNKKQQLKELLKIHYGYDSFWPGQEEVIGNILAAKDTVVIMPTGGGKSLCFQLPALVLGGVTIVISPLIALMKDQVDSLVKIGIPATFINSSISFEETNRRLKAAKDNQYKLLYIAPERFYNQEFVKALSDINVSLFAIDEAHCISQWGHDFRPSYLKLKELIELVGSPPVAALTATATPEVREDIIKQLNLKNLELIITGFARPNLQFGVILASESQKPSYVLDVINSVNGGPGIIYVGTRARADDLLEFLLNQDIDAVGYHAGMEASDRKWVQDNFMRGKARVIVATNAFGLGIDKDDIRYVIHYDMPGTVEAYYQEAGRAGRDNKKSFCLLLYSSRDRHLQEFFIKGDNPSPEIILEVYQILTSYESDAVLITYAELAEMLSESLPEMAVGTALKILEREGYIARSRERSGSAYLKLLTDYATALDCLGERAKAQRKIFSKLYEKYEKELKNGWRLNFEEIAEILNVKKDALVRTIKKLVDVGKAKYSPPFRGTEINILQKVPASQVKIDFTAMREKLKNAYKKLDLLEDYIYHLECRQKYILDYFGDPAAGECRVCDNCLVMGGYERKTKSPGEKSQKNKSGLGTKLTQLETYELYQQGMTVDEMAQVRNVKPGTIVQHLCYLIENSIDVDINKFVSKDKQKKIKQAINKVGANKLTPIKEIVGDKINWDEIRLTLAKHRLENK